MKGLSAVRPQDMVWNISDKDLYELNPTNNQPIMDEYQRPVLKKVQAPQPVRDCIVGGITQEQLDSLLSSTCAPATPDSPPKPKEVKAC